MSQHAFTVDFVDGPEAFLAAAGAYLEQNPIVNTVVATIAERQVAEIARGLPVEGIERQWWAVIRDADGGVASAAMRTATSPPYPPYLLPMADEAARGLAEVLLSRDEEVGGVNGALPAIAVFADTIAAAKGSRVETAMHSRLFELGDLVPPVGVPGELRAAVEDDIELAVEWMHGFHRDAAVQGGRDGAEPESEPDLDTERELMRRRIEAGRLWFWEVDGVQVHMSGGNPPSFGVARIGPVYTPAEYRRRGYAGAAVAAVSAEYLAGGARVCLFTDQANPTSNKVYRQIGYEPVVDMANLVLLPGADAGHGRG